MFGSALIGKLLTAIGLSAAAMTAIVACHALVWRRERQAREAELQTVQQFTLLGEHAALARFSIYPLARADTDLRHAAAVYDLSENPPRLAELLSHGLPWLVASSPASNYGFCSTGEGGLYWFDTATSPVQLVQLGSHEGGFARLLECSSDGDLLLVAAADTTLWDRAAAKMLWRRTDIIVTACAFAPQPARLICGLATGEVVALDPATGAILSRLAAHDYEVYSIAVSPDGQLLASADRGGYCLVTEIETGRRPWSRKCVVGPLVEFLPDSKSLVVSNPEYGTDLVVVALPSGKPLARLRGLTGVIRDLTVASDGTVYICSSQEVVTAWNPAADLVTGRIRPGNDLHHQMRPHSPDR